MIPSLILRRGGFFLGRWILFGKYTARGLNFEMRRVLLDSVVVRNFDVNSAFHFGAGLGGL